MKITILDQNPGEEDEVIIKCRNLTEELQSLIQKLKQGNNKLAGYDTEGIHLIEEDRIYYFEAVLDNGEKTIISRQYVPVLKERLGL